MRNVAWVDGRVVEASQLRLDTPYVMQRIHTLGGEVYGANTHVLILREASEYMFGFSSLVTAADVVRIVSKLVECANAPSNYSVPVVMRLEAHGVLSFEVENPTFGQGVYLRAKRPAGVDIEYVVPTPIIAQSSESIASDAMTARRVAHLGGDIAVRIDGDGNLISSPWSPIFVYHKGCLYTPADYPSVEYRMVAKAAKKIGVELAVYPIPCSALERVDEIFVVDIMGVSSLASIKNHRLRSTVAMKLAKVMEPK